MGAAAELVLVLLGGLVLLGWPGPPAGLPQVRAQRGRDSCPSLCVCGTWLRLPRASCTGQRLYSVYTGVSSLVQALDLSNNSIAQLEDRQLSVSVSVLPRCPGAARDTAPDALQAAAGSRRTADRAFLREPARACLISVLRGDGNNNYTESSG